MDKHAQHIKKVFSGTKLPLTGNGNQFIFDGKSGVTCVHDSANLSSISKENHNKIEGVSLEFPLKHMRDFTKI